MKKALMIFVVIAGVVAMLVPAFGAVPGFSPEQQNDVSKIQQQMLDLRIQMLDKYVAAGLMTKEKADTIKANMQKNFEIRKANGFVPAAASGQCGVGAKGYGQRGAGGCGGGGGGCGLQGGQGQYTPQSNNIY